MTDSARSARLNRVLNDILLGKKGLTNHKHFIEAICNQEDAAGCIDKLLACPDGLSFVQASLRSDLSVPFLNGAANDLLCFLQEPEIMTISNGQGLDEILLAIVDPPIFWNAFVGAFKAKQLSEGAQRSFAWTLLRLLSIPSDTVSPYIAIAEDVLPIFAASFIPVIRNAGKKIRHTISVTSSPSLVIARDDVRPAGLIPTEAPFLRPRSAVNDLSTEELREAIHPPDNQLRLMREDSIYDMREEFQIATGKQKGRSAPQPSTLTVFQNVNEGLSRRFAIDAAFNFKDFDPDSPEVVDRKVKGLLNRLTMEKFDSISDQIIVWVNKSEKETDGRTLMLVVHLLVEIATNEAADEAQWSEMYARLCRKMMEKISSKIQDEGIKNSDDKPISGGQFFKKYLLNRCQEDFERGWVNKGATAAAAAATKALEDQAAKAANEKRAEGEEEVALYSDEHYAAQKAKRQRLGLIKFIGELFKVRMLTERIMHECVKKLLGNVDNPEEEEIESLCKLLTTIGAILDTTRARAHMNSYFYRMKGWTKNSDVSPRMQFMLQNVIELRDRKWITRNTVAAPTTIAKVHEIAAKEKEKEGFQRTISMSRGGFRCGGDRSDYQQVGADGWAVAGGNALRPQPKGGDLSNFGKINKGSGAPMTFGPGSVFAGKKDNKRESLSRTNSMFQMLQNVDPATEAAARSSRPPSWKPSIDLGSGGVPDPARQRKRLILQPRSKPLEQDTTRPHDTDGSSDEQVAEEPELEMSEGRAKKKIGEDSKEFFGVRRPDEAEIY